jgi:CRP-like cAMP-binding protein
MPEARYLRISRELFLAAFGANLGGFESWVTDRLTHVLEEEEVPTGDALFSCGEPPEFFYFMREGRVRMTREGGPAWILDGRQVFGMDDAILDRCRTRTAVALDHLKLMRVRMDDWLELLDDSFELARASVITLAQSVASYEQELWTNARVRLPALVHPPDVRAQPLTVIERLAVLMDTPLLRGSGVQPLSDLAGACREVFFGPGEPVFARQVPRETIFILLEGEVKTSRNNPEIVWQSGSGEIVCGAAAFGEPALAWEAVASKETRALAFRIEDWFDLMEEHFDMVRSALGGMELQRHQLLDQLASQAVCQ